jgi:phage terminase large subunit
VFYSGELKYLEAEGRIKPIDLDRNIPVDTAWDLGRTDSTAIWFIQQVGREYRLVDYYETSGVAMHHYVETLLEKRLLHKFKYGKHYFPHDIKNKEWLSDKSRIDNLESLGIEVTVVPDHRVMDGINAVRRVLDRAFIDPDRCARGLEALRNYVREWSVELRDCRASPRHGWASHGADALGIFAIGHAEPGLRPKPQREYAPTFAPTSHWTA